MNENPIAKELSEALGFSPSTLDPKCLNCDKRQPENATREQKLKRCSRCHIALYCSRDCQTAHWKHHKSLCSLGAATHTTYLDTLPTENEAMDQLIDAYRLRVEDDYAWRGENRGLYAQEDPLPDFRHFLDLTEQRPGVLPKWWNKEKRKVCERRATNEDNWCCIAYAVEKPDIQEHYKNNMMPMTLRMLAEQVYGTGVA
ncbi:hypothetical protein APHAL10511_005465 [Amanita phalloides]|nr:hypothetical protein APHAL10511_005465 [Amanita phalloides]